MTAVLWFARHDTAWLILCGLLMATATRLYRTSRQMERDLDRILGPDRRAHVQRDQAWRRISR